MHLFTCLDLLNTQQMHKKHLKQNTNMHRKHLILKTQEQLSTIVLQILVIIVGLEGFQIFTTKTTDYTFKGDM